MNTEIFSLGLSIAGMVLAMFVAVWCIREWQERRKLKHQDDAYDLGHEDGYVDAFDDIQNDPHILLKQLSEDFSFEAVKITLFGMESCYEFAKGLKDDVLKDMRNEEKYLYKRLLGACEVGLSEEFKGWSDKDKAMFREQAYGMMIYHSNLWARCCRFGVIVSKE